MTSLANSSTSSYALLLSHCRLYLPPNLLTSLQPSSHSTSNETLATLLLPLFSNPTTLTLTTPLTKSIEPLIAIITSPAHLTSPLNLLIILASLKCTIQASQSSSSSSLPSSLLPHLLKHISNLLISTSTSVTISYDIILPLLRTIQTLPVTASTVKESGAAKSVKALQKRIEKEQQRQQSGNDTGTSTGGNNSRALEALQIVKDTWTETCSGSLKKRSVDVSNGYGNDGEIAKVKKSKIEISSIPVTSMPIKKKKTVAVALPALAISIPKKSFSIASMLKKQKQSSSSSSSLQSINSAAKSDKARLRIEEIERKNKENITYSSSLTPPPTLCDDDTAKPKKIKKTVSWSPKLSTTKTYEPLLTEEEQQLLEIKLASGTINYKERRKLENATEKNMLRVSKEAEEKSTKEANEVKEKLLNDMQPTMKWQKLQRVHGYQSVMVESRGREVEGERIKTVLMVSYPLLEDMPGNPTKLTEEEMEVVMEEVGGTKTEAFNWLDAEEKLEKEKESLVVSTSFATSLAPSSSASASASAAAFSSLHSFAPPLSQFNSGYDSSFAPPPPSQISQSSHTSFAPPPPASSLSSSSSSFIGYGHSQSLTPPSSNESIMSTPNLHVSNYGPNTTSADITSLFSPHIRVTGVFMMKEGFAFVNSDSINAAIGAKMVLEGAILDGRAIRINSADRREKEAAGKNNVNPNNNNSANANHRNGEPAVYNNIKGISFVTNPAKLESMKAYRKSMLTALPIDRDGNVDFGRVFDEKGMCASKSLFVAGFGPGTTVDDIKSSFSKYVGVISVIMKKDYCFVNTSDRGGAVNVRENLLGEILNGGVMTINYAKDRTLGSNNNNSSNGGYVSR